MDHHANPDRDSVLTNNEDERLGWTAEEFIRMNLGGRPHELVRGIAVSVQPPDPKSARIRDNARRILDRYGRRYGNGTILPDNAPLVTQRNPDTVRTADLGFSWNSSWDFDDWLGYLFQEPPELMVILLNDKRRTPDPHQIATEYLTAGASMVWAINPDKQWLGVYRDDEPFQLFQYKDELPDFDELPDLACSVAKFFE